MQERGITNQFSLMISRLFLSGSQSHKNLETKVRR